MTTTQPETFENLNVTHLMIVCPRGFSNERSVWAIPSDCVQDAERVERNANPEGYCDRTRLVSIENASSSDRKEAGRRLNWEKEVAENYRTALYLFGPLMNALEY